MRKKNPVVLTDRGENLMLAVLGYGSAALILGLFVIVLTFNPWK